MVSTGMATVSDASDHLLINGKQGGVCGFQGPLATVLPRKPKIRGGAKLGGRRHGGTEAHLLGPPDTACGLLGWAFVVGRIFCPRTDAEGKRRHRRERQVRRGYFSRMFDSILAAVALPGALVVLLTIAAAVIRAQDVRRRDAVRRFSRQQRREGMARAGGQCEMETGLGAVVFGPLSTGTTFTRGPKVDPPPSRTSLPPAPDATGRKGPGFRRRASRKDWNDDGGTTSCPAHPSVSANGSRSPDRRARGW